MNTLEVMAKAGGLLAGLTQVHFAADWLFQSHDEAMAKSSNSRVRAKHCLVYTILTLALILVVDRDPLRLLAYAMILWCSHFVEDTYLPVYLWAKFIRKPPEFTADPTGKSEKERFIQFASTPLGKILLIAVDQIIHVSYLVVISFMLLTSGWVFWSIFGATMGTIGILGYASWKAQGSFS